jgi:hypothetical protein
MLWTNLDLYSCNLESLILLNQFVMERTFEKPYFDWNSLNLMSILNGHSDLVPNYCSGSSGQIRFINDTNKIIFSSVTINSSEVKKWIKLDTMGVEKY